MIGSQFYVTQIHVGCRTRLPRARAVCRINCRPSDGYWPSSCFLGPLLNSRNRTCSWISFETRGSAVFPECWCTWHMCMYTIFMYKRHTCFPTRVSTQWDLIYYVVRDDGRKGKVIETLNDFDGRNFLTRASLFTRHGGESKRDSGRKRVISVIGKEIFLTAWFCVP